MTHALQTLVIDLTIIVLLLLLALGSWVLLKYMFDLAKGLIKLTFDINADIAAKKQQIKELEAKQQQAPPKPRKTFPTSSFESLKKAIEEEKEKEPLKVIVFYDNKFYAAHHNSFAGYIKKTDELRNFCVRNKLDWCFNDNRPLALIYQIRSNLNPLQEEALFKIVDFRFLSGQQIGNEIYNAMYTSMQKL